MIGKEVRFRHNTSYNATKDTMNGSNKNPKQSTTVHMPHNRWYVVSVVLAIIQKHDNGGHVTYFCAALQLSQNLSISGAGQLACRRKHRSSITATGKRSGMISTSKAVSGCSLCIKPSHTRLRTSDDASLAELTAGADPPASTECEGSCTR